MFKRSQAAGILRCDKEPILSLCFLNKKVFKNDCFKSLKEEFSSLLVSGSSTGQLLLWDLETKRIILNKENSHLKGITEIRTIQFMNYFIIITQGRDGFLNFWNLDNEKISFNLIFSYQLNAIGFIKFDLKLIKNILSIITTNSNEHVPIIVKFKIELKSNLLEINFFMEKKIECEETDAEVMQVKFINDNFFVILFESGVLYLCDMNLKVIDISKPKLDTHFTFDIWIGNKNWFYGAVTTCKRIIRGFLIKETDGILQINYLKKPIVELNDSFETISNSLKLFSHQKVNNDIVNDDELNLSKGSSSICYSKKGYLIIGGWDGTIKVYNSKDLILVKELKHHKSSIKSLIINQELDILAVGSDDGKISLWKL